MRHRILPGICLLAVLACSGAETTSPTSRPESRTSAAASRPSGSPTSMRVLDRAAGFIERTISTDAISENLKQLVAKPHVAGSPANRQTAELVASAFRAAGLDVRIDEYDVLLPYPAEMTVELVKPVAYRCPMMEEPVDADYDTHTTAAIPPFLAYAADGDVTGRLVYVNHGTVADYQRLASLGVDLRGAIGIARYGKIYRGTKVVEARKRGLAALLIYSDPADDGFVRGPVYPQGPWRPKSAVQRGSILDIAQRPGDPLTPDGAAKPDAMRLAGEAVENLPGLPAAALSWGDAEPMLKLLEGPAVPDGWQGGLPFTYRVGATNAVIAHVRTQSDWSSRRIANVIGTLRGAVAPDDWVMMGSHRDAWVHGAVDPGSGTAIMMDVARTLGAMSKDGLAPDRSIVLCSWDAEEFGLIGSTEFIDEFGQDVADRCVLYLNCDAPITGSELSAEGSPALGEIFREALGRVRDDRLSGPTLLDDLTARKALELTPPGGGSDFVGFLAKAAVPCGSISSGGPYGVYHSLFDTYGWMKKYGDPSFRAHARVGRAAAMVLFVAATSALLPLDEAAEIRWVRKAVESLALKHPAVDPTRLQTSLAQAAIAAAECDAARDALLATDPDPSRLVAINHATLLAPRAFVSDGPAVADRPFYRNLLVATDPGNGYGAIPLPGLAQASDAGASGEITRQSERLRSAIDDYAARLTRIARLMQAAAQPAAR